MVKILDAPPGHLKCPLLKGGIKSGHKIFCHHLLFLIRPNFLKSVENWLSYLPKCGPKTLEYGLENFLSVFELYQKLKDAPPKKLGVGAKFPLPGI